MSVQDKVDKDLRRFMFDDMPDNVDDLAALKKWQISDSVVKKQDGEVIERPLFSDAVNKELAKHRPSDIQRKRALAKFGLAFSGLGVFSFVVLPEPVNWVMASGSLIPFVVPLLISKIRKRRVRRP